MLYDRMPQGKISSLIPTVLHRTVPKVIVRNDSSVFPEKDPESVFLLHQQTLVAPGGLGNRQDSLHMAAVAVCVTLHFDNRP